MLINRDCDYLMAISFRSEYDNIHRNDTATETDSSRMRKESSQDVQLPEPSGTSSHENFTPSLARRLSRQFIEQTRHALPRSPSIPRDRLYRSSTEEPTSSLSSTLLPERSEYRSRSSDRNIRRTNSLLDAKRPERPDYKSTRRSVSLFADDDDDDELLSPMPRQVMTLGRKYRDPVKPSTNGIRRDIFSRTEKIQEESHDELNSPRKIFDSNSEVTLEPASTSEGTSICNSNPNLGDTLSTLSTKSCETSSTESTSNNQGEALNSFKADAKDFESRLLAAENLIKESKLRNLGVNHFDPNLKSSYKDTDKCDKEFLGSMTDLTNSVLSKRRSCIPSLRIRSGSLTRESSNSYDRRPPLVGGGDTRDIRAPTPERSLLSKLFRSSSTSRDNENKDKSPKARRRISRFLRPDFFDTPREESQYVKEKEAQKAAENERRKARFMKKKVGSKESSVEKSVSVEEKPEKELKNEANALTRDKNDAPKDNKSDNDSSSIIIANTDAKLERQNSKNSFLQSLEKKLEKLRSNDSDSSKVNNDDDNEKVSVSANEENKMTLMTPVKETGEKSEILKKAASIDDPSSSSSVNEAPVTTTKSRVSSVLGLFRNDSKSTINGTRQQNNILSKFKKSAYKGSRSDSIVLTGEPSAGSKIPTKSMKTESKSPRRSLESKKSPEKNIEIKKSPPKEKSKEKTPTERLSVERKLSVDRQVKSPKKLSPEKLTDVKVDKNEKLNIKDQSVEKDIQRKSSSPEKNDSKNSLTGRLTKKSSPDKVLDNKKSEIKNTDNEDKKVVKVKKTVKNLTSLTKNGSITKLEKDDESDKKIKKVVKKESVDKEGIDGTKKKKIVRVVKKVVKKSDGSSDSKSEDKEKSTTKTLLKKITSSTKKENSPESIEKNKEKTPTDIDNKKKEMSPVPKIIEDNDSTTIKIDAPTTTADTKISTKESDNKLRTNRSNLKLDLSKIPQHSFKTSGNTKKESPKLNSTDDSKSEISEKPQENISKLTHHANITGNKIIIDKPLRAADILELQRESDTKTKTESNKTINPPKVEAEFKIQPNIESQINLNINKTELEMKDKPSPLQENPKQYINKIPQQKITSDYAEDILSPMDDGESFDSWSICSNDMNHRGSMDLHSPTSPTYSPSTRNDHPESIIDRIRRKSFYSRFNERKRKSSLNVPPSGVTLPTSSTLPRKYSFHSSRDTERSRRNYSISPTRRSSDRVYSLYNDDPSSAYRKSPIERDRYSDVGSSLSSFSGELKSPSDQYGSGSTSYYDSLSRYRISPISDSTHRKYPSTDFGLDSDLTSYKSPMSPSALNDGISDYRSNLSRRYGSVASGLAPKTAEYYEELLAPSRIDYLSARRTPVPGEYSGKYENGYHNGHSELSQSNSDKWRGYSDKITGLDSAEDSDRSRGDDIRFVEN
ncbi:hypothetical protein PV326_007804 [Microctonus aethiopoides]|nr:hypothetical protein PV326_007804 [Microctonus aethiopoides]